MSIRRFFIELSYNGTAYHGWQIQPNAITVQEILDKSLSTILRCPIDTLGCGRTDTGVHARQFFAHFDISSESVSIDNNIPAFIIKLNAVLPKDIAVYNIIAVAHDAHARFDAVSRSYEYHIHFKKDPFKNGLSWLLRDIPNIESMNKAAKILMEYEDFSCFSKSNTQTFTNNCEISNANWVEVDNGIVFRITANRFLRNMVRAIVGTLVDIGLGKMAPENIRAILTSKDRSMAGASVPACGLFLTQIKYPYFTN